MDSLDVYTGQSANWDNRAIAIIEFLLERQGQPYTYAEISNVLGIPNVEVSRYLREESFEKRDYEWLLDMKKFNPKAYAYYLQNHKIRKITMPDGRVKHIVYVNFSKHTVFLMNCRLKNAQVKYEKVGKRKIVHLFPHVENERTTLYYEKPQIDFEELATEYDEYADSYDY